MKYSERMLKGCEMSEQTKGVLFERIDGRVTQTCARGAAALAAVGGPGTSETVAAYDAKMIDQAVRFDTREIYEATGTDPYSAIDCPDDSLGECCRNHPRNLVKTIEHLNDTHGWTREEIAGWLAKEWNL